MKTQHILFGVGGALAVCTLAALVGFDGGVGTDVSDRTSRPLGAALEDAGAAFAVENEDGGTTTATPSDELAPGEGRPLVLDSFPSESAISGWSDVNEQSITDRMTPTLSAVDVDVDGVECRERSCFIDISTESDRILMATHEVVFASLMLMSTRACEFGALPFSHGAEGRTTQRLYFYCYPNTRPNFAHFDESPVIARKVAETRDDMAEMGLAVPPLTEEE